MKRRGFFGALAVLPFVGKLAPRTIAVKPGETIRTGWIHVRMPPPSVLTYATGTPIGRLEQVSELLAQGFISPGDAQRMIDGVCLS